MHRYLSGLWAAVLATAAGATAWAEEAPGAPAPPKPPQIILLKFDGLEPSEECCPPVSERWSRLTDYLTQNNIHAAYGVVCCCLEKDDPAYFEWIRSVHAKGNIEFWLHGYREHSDKDRKGEFESGTVADQKLILEKAEKLAQDRLGFEFTSFGTYWSASTEATAEALNAIPEIKIWLDRPRYAKQFHKFGIPRLIMLENLSHITDKEMFLRAYDAVGVKQDMLLLQGHPNSWNETRWNGFLKMMAFLKSKGCIFLTPTEYMDAMVNGTRPMAIPASGSVPAAWSTLPEKEPPPPLPTLNLHPPQFHPPQLLPTAPPTQQASPPPQPAPQPPPTQQPPPPPPHLQVQSASNQ